MVDATCASLFRLRPTHFCVCSRCSGSDARRVTSNPLVVKRARVDSMNVLSPARRPPPKPPALLALSGGGAVGGAIAGSTSTAAAPGDRLGSALRKARASGFVLGASANRVLTNSPQPSPIIASDSKSPVIGAGVFAFSSPLALTQSTPDKPHTRKPVRRQSTFAAPPDKPSRQPSLTNALSAVAEDAGRAAFVNPLSSAARHMAAASRDREREIELPSAVDRGTFSSPNPLAAARGSVRNLMSPVDGGARASIASVGASNPISTSALRGLVGYKKTATGVALPAPPAIAEEASVAPGSTLWVEKFDPAAGHRYYWNSKLRVTQVCSSCAGVCSLNIAA